MTLEKQTIIDKIEVLADGQIQIRSANLIFENGIEISKTYHRHVIAPGDYIEQEDARVISIANVVWTDEVIEAYQNRVSELPI